MAIKQIDELPKEAKNVSQRELIRADIHEAFDKNIRKFEFIDDRYNYKYLAQYVKEEADWIFDIKVSKRLKELQSAGIVEKNHYYIRHYSVRNYPPYISITKSKQEDRIHVYCEIFPERLDDIILKAVDEHKRNMENRKALEEQRKKRKEALNARKDNAGNDRQE